LIIRQVSKVEQPLKPLIRGKAARPRQLGCA
jgi:hypothetical protein